MHVIGFITQAPVIRKILDHTGRRFDPLKLPGRSPPLWDMLPAIINEELFMSSSLPPISDVR
jgi:hypothetical protein